MPPGVRLDRRFPRLLLALWVRSARPGRGLPEVPRNPPRVEPDGPGPCLPVRRVRPRPQGAPEVPEGGPGLDVQGLVRRPAGARACLRAVLIGAPRPGSDAWRVLELVVRHPGQLDAEAIGQRLWRPRLTSTADYLRVRAATRAGAPTWSRAAGVLLGRLTAAGYVLPVQPPELAETAWSPDPSLEVGTMAWALAVTCSQIEREQDGRADGAELANASRLLSDLVQRGPRTVAAWAGASPSGATKRAMHALYEAGLVVPGCFRRPTAKGEALVERREVAGG